MKLSTMSYDQKVFELGWDFIMAGKLADAAAAAASVASQF